jgi:CubicO group peptidase (beta-lactamase class C family)
MERTRAEARARSIPLGTIAAALCVISTAASCNSTPPAASLPAGLADIDSYMLGAMESFHVPGLALGIVKDDKVVFAKGYGMKDLAARSPVDERTIFSIGSATKGMSAAMLAVLVDKGLIEWDRPVKAYLPDFKLSDPASTEQVTIRDLIGMRSGLPEQVSLMAWFPFGNDYEEIASMSGLFPLSGPPGAAYAYDNITHYIAARIAERVTGKSYAKLVEDYLFKPMGMSSSSAFRTDFGTNPAIATGYDIVDAQPLPVSPAFREWTQKLGPAGSVSSSLSDMLKYLRMQLGGGMLDGKRIVPEKALKDTWEISISAKDNPNGLVVVPDGGTSYQGYCMGWIAYEHRGKKVLWHAGQVPGGIAMIAMMPEEGIGYVALSNSYIQPLPFLLNGVVFNAFLGIPRDDILERSLPILAANSTTPGYPGKVEGAAPTLELSAYAGTFGNVAGSFEITAGADGALRLRVPRTGFAATLSAWAPDCYLVRWDDEWMPPMLSALLAFSVADGKVEKASMIGAGALPPFTRVR